MSAPKQSLEDGNQASPADGGTKAKAKTDPVSLVSALFVLALPVTFIGLNFWSGSFARTSYQVLQPVNNYLGKGVEYMFVSIGRFLWLNLFGLCFAVIVHELGHITAGLMAGLDFKMTAFGPLRIHGSGKISFGMGIGNIVLGSAEMGLTETNHSLSSLLVFGSGGTAANLLCGVVIVVLSTHPVAINLAFYSVVAGLSSLVPYRYLNFSSDGRQIYALLFERNKLLSAMPACK